MASEMPDAQCPKCGKGFSSNNGKWGEEGVCPHCGAAVSVTPSRKKIEPAGIKKIEQHWRNMSLLELHHRENTFAPAEFPAPVASVIRGVLAERSEELSAYRDQLEEQIEEERKQEHEREIQKRSTQRWIGCLGRILLCVLCIALFWPRLFGTSSRPAAISLVFVHFVYTYSIGLTPALVVRYVLLRRPMQKFSAFLLTGVFAVCNLLLFTSVQFLTGTPLWGTSGGTVGIVSVIVFMILRVEKSSDTGGNE